MDNLVKLDVLNDDSILEAIQERYRSNDIYTYVGDMLLAVNPYKSLPIYGMDTKSLHQPDLPVASAPHIYAIAQKAFKNMQVLGRSQVCLISGESGAGKTETAKFFLSHLLNFDGSDSTVLERRILESQPLLEAFGNAKTKLNDNSSRFGKFVEIMYTNGQVVGARVEKYLLEKSRLVGRPDGEANFHVFYYLLTGTPAWIREGLDMMDVDSYNYIQAGGHLVGPQTKEKLQARRRCSSKYDFAGSAMVTDVVKYEELMETMHVLHFHEEELGQLHTLLMALLTLGNIDFVSEVPDDPDAECLLRSSAPLLQFGMLCGIDPVDLEPILTLQVRMLRGEAIATPLRVSQAIDTRDAIAKFIYEHLFTWLVRRLNERLSPRVENADNTSNSQSSLPSVSDPTVIAVLDIFGFEDFHRNGFEQLCINTANEQLQYFFNQHIFTWELQEYQSEGISPTDVVFEDNQAQINLLLGTPVGIFTLIDEESKLSSSTASSLRTKLVKIFGKHRHFSTERLRPTAFGVIHYAGRVYYSTDGLIERNRNAHVPAIVPLMRRSPSVLLRAIFEAPDVDPNSNPPGSSDRRPPRTNFADVGGKRRQSKARRVSEHRLPRGQNNTWRLRGILKNKPKRATTLGGMFRESLRLLMAKLEASTPHFVRCIKPNAHKAPEEFETVLVHQQLKYTGVMETARIRMEGYAIRLKFAAFVAQYKIIGFPLSDPTSGNINECLVILRASGLTGYQMGRTKVFLKFHHSAILMDALTGFHTHAAVIQRSYRRHIAKRVVAEKRREYVARRAREEADAAAAQECEAQAAAAAEQHRQRLSVEENAQQHNPSEQQHAISYQETTCENAAAPEQLLAPHPELIEERQVSSKSILIAPSGTMYGFENQASSNTPNGNNDAGGDEGANETDPIAPLAHRILEQQTACGDTVVKAADPKTPKVGTVTKGDVQGARAMFQHFAALDAGRGDGVPDAKHGTLTRGVNVAFAARSFKFRMETEDKSFKTGPALPRVKPGKARQWAQAKVPERLMHPPMGIHQILSGGQSPGTRGVQQNRSSDSSLDSSAGFGTIMRKQADMSSFLAELSMQRIYGRMVVDAGISHPGDFNLFSDHELKDIGFKIAHIKKIRHALKAAADVNKDTRKQKRGRTTRSTQPRA